MKNFLFRKISCTSFATMLLVGMFLAGCSASTASPESRLRVVATTGPLGDAIVRVGGEHVRVDVLMGPGVDPHLFMASEGDVNLLQQADVLFYNGLFLEAQIADVLRQIGERKPSVAVAERIDPALLLVGPDSSGEYDPHVWFDVPLWKQVVETVSATLADVDAANAGAYRANADIYLQELEELHRYVQERAAELPAERRVLITAHDAFHYFGRAYGFEVRGLQGISTATEAGTADVRALADFIAQRQIPAIFIESSVPVRNVEAIQAAVAARGAAVEIGGELYSDALGGAESAGATYIGMMRHNIDTIVDALKDEE